MNEYLEFLCVNRSFLEIDNQSFRRIVGDFEGSDLGNRDQEE